jgi:hypothetical protein
MDNSQLSSRSCYNNSNSSNSSTLSRRNKPMLPPSRRSFSPSSKLRTHERGLYRSSRRTGPTLPRRRKSLLPHRLKMEHRSYPRRRVRLYGEEL